MCTHNQCFAQKYEKYNFSSENIFTAVKYCCILHGRVFVMYLLRLSLLLLLLLSRERDRDLERLDDLEQQ